MKDNKLTFRYAKEADAALILDFIKGIAAYEKMENQVVATEELLHYWLFEQKKAEVIIGEIEGCPIGFALFFHNFSTFVGRAGLYLEDLFILPEYRGNGFGKLFFKQLAKIAVERGCGRFEWCCLDWNEPSIGFYKAMGAVAMDEWTTYRIAGDTLSDLAGG